MEMTICWILGYLAIMWSTRNGLSAETYVVFCVFLAVILIVPVDPAYTDINVRVILGGAVITVLVSLFNIARRHIRNVTS